MSTKKAIFFLAFCAIFLTAISADAATVTPNNRYFVKSTSAFWEKSFQARNVFNNGFTANLNVLQLRLAQIFGIDVQPVHRLNILAKKPAKPAPTPVSNSPSDNIPWGVRFVLNNSTDKPTGGDGVTVAVLDTGVNTAHQDLADRVTGCIDFSGFSAMTDGTCADNNGHGTHVAGIIAADGGSDGSGIYGMAPKSNLLIYKVCSDDGTCYADDVAAAITYATDHGANIILISSGSDTDSDLIASALQYAADHDVMVIAAAGNDGPYSGSIDYPASDVNAVSVGAIDANTNVADWSARGLNSTDKMYVKEPGDLDFVAPGVNIQSTWNNGGYATLSGTSMAAAHVAGLAALEWQGTADHPVSATLDILHKFSHDIPPLGDDDASGWGVPQL